MEIGLKTRRPIRPPANELWPAATTSNGLTIKWPIRFDTRDALDAFVSALEVATAQPVVIRVPVPPRYVGYFEEADDIQSTDALFAFTERPIHRLTFLTATGTIFIDNKVGICSVSAHNDVPQQVGAEPKIGDVAGNATQLVQILARYATAKWAFPRLRIVPVVTRVPAHETRNRIWQLKVGGWSVFLGGLAGVAGTILTNLTHTPGG